MRPFSPAVLSSLKLNPLHWVVSCCLKGKGRKEWNKTQSFSSSVQMPFLSTLETDCYFSQRSLSSGGYHFLTKHPGQGIVYKMHPRRIKSEWEAHFSLSLGLLQHVREQYVINKGRIHDLKPFLCLDCEKWETRLELSPFPCLGTCLTAQSNVSPMAFHQSSHIPHNSKHTHTHTQTPREVEIFRKLEQCADTCSLWNVLSWQQRPS